MSHVRSKTRSLGHFFFKKLVSTLEASFASVFMELHQNVCLDDNLIKFKCESCGNKNKVTITDFV